MNHPLYMYIYIYIYICNNFNNSNNNNLIIIIIILILQNVIIFVYNTFLLYNNLSDLCRVSVILIVKIL